MARKVRVEIVADGVRVERARSGSSRTLARRLWPALTIILLAGGIAVKRVKIEDWPGLGPIGWRAKAADRPVETARSELAANGRVSIRDRAIFSQSIAPPMPKKPVDRALAKLDVSKLFAREFDSARIVEPEPNRLNVEPRDIDPNEFLDQIRREAAAKRQEQAEATKFKRDVADWLKRDEVRYERERDHKLRDQADEDRDVFFRRLRQAIDLPDDEAAKAIVQACAEHKGEVGKVTVARLHKMLEEGNVRGLPIPARIRRYRAIGIPEPYILGEIARSQFDRIGERGGPSSKARAIANAARSVLAEKPKPRAALVRAKPDS